MVFNPFKMAVHFFWTASSFPNIDGPNAFPKFNMPLALTSKRYENPRTTYCFYEITDSAGLEWGKLTVLNGDNLITYCFYNEITNSAGLEWGKLTVLNGENLLF